MKNNILLTMFGLLWGAFTGNLRYEAGFDFWSIQNQILIIVPILAMALWATSWKETQ